MHFGLAFLSCSDVRRKRGFFCFMLYLACSSTLSRLSLVLRHSAPHFPLNAKGIAGGVAEFDVPLCLDTRASY